MILGKGPAINPTVVRENEDVAQRAHRQGDYVLCFLLAHALVESLLRTFLERSGKESFNDLIDFYGELMESEGQTEPTFVKELIQLNRRRNRIVHQLWGQGYSAINEGLEPACRAAFIVYGLLIEWIETFEPEITHSGFQYE